MVKIRTYRSIPAAGTRFLLYFDMQAIMGHCTENVHAQPLSTPLAEVQIPIDEREALPLCALGGGNDRRQTAPPVIENKGLGSSIKVEVKKKISPMAAIFLASQPS